MSATAAFLPCPICAHSGVFETVQSLRDRLIYVCTNKILCPVCQEEVTGLDKLTIHLFSHVKMIATKNCGDKLVCNDTKNKSKNENQVTPQQQKLSKSPTAKNKTSSSTAVAAMKYVKIYPKLPTVSPNAVPIMDVSGGSLNECRQTAFVPAMKTIKTEATIIAANTTCNICGLQFVDADILRMHKCLIHNIDEGSNQNFTHYQCHLCPKNFKMRGSLMVHLRVAHFGFLSGNSSTSENNKQRLEGAFTDTTDIDKCIAMERNDNKQWQCDVCRKCFTTKYFLKKHKRLHTGETPYACSQCNKTFTFQQSYHKHLLYHNDEKPHTCSYCGRAFKELSTLHNHQRIHTGEKPFSCETCGKCFRQRVSYLVHRRIHTGVMPYKCTACEKSFRYKVSQRTHKCQSKPPGTVVRQSGNLIEKLKKKHIDTGGVSSENVNQDQLADKPLFLEVSEANAELVRTGAKLSLEDMEADNFTLLAEHFEYNNNQIKHLDELNTSITPSEGHAIIDTNLDDLIDSIPSIDKNIPSPSEILKNLCLSKDENYEGPSEQIDAKHYDLYNDFSTLL